MKRYIHNYISILFLFLTSYSYINARLLTIMIDPSGDVRQPGREIEDCFEHGITMQCAQKLKQTIETDNKSVRIILTRSAGEALEYGQAASFANRLQVDFYITILFYYSHETTHKINLYHTAYNPQTDYWPKKDNNLILLPYDQAYKININKTRNFINLMFNSIKNNEKKYDLACAEILNIPINLTKGICAPAISIEISLNQKDNWKKIIDPLVESINEVINSFGSIK